MTCPSCAIGIDAIRICRSDAAAVGVTGGGVASGNGGSGIGGTGNVGKVGNVGNVGKVGNPKTCVFTVGAAATVARVANVISLCGTASIGKRDDEKVAMSAPF